MKKAVESNEKLSNDYTKIKKEFEDLAAKNKIRDKVIFWCIVYINLKCFKHLKIMLSKKKKRLI